MRPERVVVAGIDEAGLGPLLGPLVLGYAAFEVPCPDGVDDPSGLLWAGLEDAVAREPQRDSERLIVADSKLVHTRTPRGEARLERTALAFLAQLAHGRWPADGRALVLAPPRELRCADELYARDPWYGGFERALPAFGAAGVLDGHTSRLAASLLRERMQLIGAGCCVHPAADLNSCWRESNNKALTLWRKAAAVLQWLWETAAGERDARLLVTVDRQGARRRYAELLHEAFPMTRITVVQESADDSRYVVRGRLPEREMHLRFVERAEGLSFPVALASCLAKYARELSMSAFNEFFAALQPDLRPTAGYVEDGRRWIREARPALERCRIPTDVLIRER